METLEEIKNMAIENFSSTGVNILKALLVLLIGWILIKLMLRILKKSLKFIKVDKLSNKINAIEIIEGKKLNVDVEQLLLTVLKWVALLVLLVIVSEMMEINMLSEGIAGLIGFLPKVLSGTAVFVIGLFIANAVKKGIQSFFKTLELSGSKIISQLVFFVILILVSVTALNQAGINTDLITSNLNLIFGAVLAAFAIAIGLGARNVVADLLRTFYVRRLYELGQTIKVKGLEGDIEAIDDISLTLKTKTGKTIIPIKEIVDNQVEIQG
ncbi:MAG: mechanosensitive ion channel [Flavobacteriaceae bacterium]|nr:mechanosensitive ion channel [Flavobacteriaceae bacterium]